MRQSVTQKLDYGCGVACFAYVCDISFEQAIEFLGKAYSVKHGWRPSDLVIELKRYGLNYKNHYVRKKHSIDFLDGTIVLIEKSQAYPVGHYFAFDHGLWMDPWINMIKDTTLKNATSGFRQSLPGQVMYAITPVK